MASLRPRKSGSWYARYNGMNENGVKKEKQITIENSSLVDCKREICRG